MTPVKCTTPSIPRTHLQERACKRALAKALLQARRSSLQHARPHRGLRRAVTRTSQAARRTGTRCRSSASTSALPCRPAGTLAARRASGAVPAKPCRAAAAQLSAGHMGPACARMHLLVSAGQCARALHYCQHDHYVARAEPGPPTHAINCNTGLCPQDGGAAADRGAAH